MPKAVKGKDKGKEKGKGKGKEKDTEHNTEQDTEKEGGRKPREDAWTPVELEVLKRLIYIEFRRPWTEKEFDKMAEILCSLFSDMRNYTNAAVKKRIGTITNEDFNLSFANLACKTPAEFTPEELMEIWRLHTEDPGRPDQEIGERMIEFTRDKQTRTFWEFPNLDEFYNTRAIAWIRNYLQRETPLAWSGEAESFMWRIYTACLYKEGGKTDQDMEWPERIYNNEFITVVMERLFKGERFTEKAIMQWVIGLIRKSQTKSNFDKDRDLGDPFDAINYYESAGPVPVKYGRYTNEGFLSIEANPEIGIPEMTIRIGGVGALLIEEETRHKKDKDENDYLGYTDYNDFRLMILERKPSADPGVVASAGGSRGPDRPGDYEKFKELHPDSNIYGPNYTYPGGWNYIYPEGSGGSKSETTADLPTREGKKQAGADTDADADLGTAPSPPAPSAPKSSRGSTSKATPGPSTRKSKDRADTAMAPPTSSASGSKAGSGSKTSGGSSGKTGKGASSGSGKKTTRKKPS